MTPSSPDANSPLPQYGFAAELDFDKLITNNRFLFRVYTPKPRPSLDDSEPYFIAQKYDKRYAPSPKELTASRSFDQEPISRSATYADVVRHMDWTTRASSPFISTSFSFIWSIWEALRRYHQGIKKDVEIAVIDAWALSGQAVTAIQLLRLSESKEEKYWKWYRFAQESQSVLVYESIPASAVYASIPLLQLLEKLPSYFLRPGASQTKENPLGTIAWNYTEKKPNYRHFCQQMTNSFLQASPEIQLRDTTTASVRLAAVFLRPWFHSKVLEDFNLSISTLRNLSILIAQWPGQWWARDHKEMWDLIRAMVLALAEEVREERRNATREHANVLRLQRSIDQLEGMVREYQDQIVAETAQHALLGSNNASTSPQPAPLITQDLDDHIPHVLSPIAEVDSPVEAREPVASPQEPLSLPPIVPVPFSLDLASPTSDQSSPAELDYLFSPNSRTRTRSILQALEGLDLRSIAPILEPAAPPSLSIITGNISAPRPQPQTPDLPPSPISPISPSSPSDSPTGTSSTSFVQIELPDVSVSPELDTDSSTSERSSLVAPLTPVIQSPSISIGFLPEVMSRPASPAEFGEISAPVQIERISSTSSNGSRGVDLPTSIPSVEDHAGSLESEDEEHNSTLEGSILLDNAASVPLPPSPNFSIGPLPEIMSRPSSPAEFGEISAPVQVERVSSTSSNGSRGVDLPASIPSVEDHTGSLESEDEEDSSMLEGSILLDKAASVPLPPSPVDSEEDVDPVLVLVREHKRPQHQHQHSIESSTSTLVSLDDVAAIPLPVSPVSKSPISPTSPTSPFSISSTKVDLDLSGKGKGREKDLLEFDLDDEFLKERPGTGVELELEVDDDDDDDEVVELPTNTNVRRSKEKEATSPIYPPPYPHIHELPRPTAPFPIRPHVPEAPPPQQREQPSTLSLASCLLGGFLVGAYITICLLSPQRRTLITHLT
ncbi:hypothetical protein BDN72DRAFT_446050 [Pluteus cervinus]|uniref:Uncharacterized protein n=1 Tax=Pluteus cervinus TaxID=181527 RepID=A0ACD3BC24_9AGAR|nr:hypothetical protein BDN72DRAFT_446050 [Pluteus cervinus]